MNTIKYQIIGQGNVHSDKILHYFANDKEKVFRLVLFVLFWFVKLGGIA